MSQSLRLFRVSILPICSKLYHFSAHVTGVMPCRVRDGRVAAAAADHRPISAAAPCGPVCQTGQRAVAAAVGLMVKPPAAADRVPKLVIMPPTEAGRCRPCGQGPDRGTQSSSSLQCLNWSLPRATDTSQTVDTSHQFDSFISRFTPIDQLQVEKKFLFIS